MTVYVVILSVEKVPEDVRLVILERLEVEVILSHIHLGESIRNYPQENFLLSYKKQNVIYGSKSVKILTWWWYF